MRRTARSHPERLTSDQRYSFIAAFLGWSMDAFDYFLVVLVISDIAADPTFHATLTQLAFVTTATLMMRPLGAFMFGLWADRSGRRIPLIVDVLFYSVCGVLCALAPNLTVLVILRLLYGIGMGGEWGLGTALALEKLPVERRGFFSGLLQAGYSIGYLLASLAYLVVFTVLHLDWRWIFVVSIAPALVSLILRFRVTESEVWRESRTRMLQTQTSLKDFVANPVVIRRFAYLVVLMTAFNWMSHGTQDLYPSFLKAHVDGGAGLGLSLTVWVVVLYNVGAVIGGVVFGALSERFGRRHTIVFCSVLALPILPIFAYAGWGAGTLTLGAFGMQLAVQGAWGVIPAHLTELSPGPVRGLYLGVPYQLGNMLAALNLPIQAYLAHRSGYTDALLWTVGPVLLAVIIATLVGPEAKGLVLRHRAGPADDADPVRPGQYTFTD